MAAKGPYPYKEICRVEIGDNFWVVVSERVADGKIIVATANVVQAEGRTKTVFLANPLILRDVEALGDMGNCLLDAHETLKKRQQAISGK